MTELENLEKQILKEEQYEHEQKEEELFNSFFKHVEFLELESEKKEEIGKGISESSRGGKLYWWQIILSAIIGTLGLLHDSTTVVIGAMLVAPLFKPIMGLGYGIARGLGKVFFHSLKVVCISILLAILVGYLITVLTGLSIETGEILARVDPNIIDFFIAIFSAIIAVLGIKYERFGNSSVIGVSLAVSLLLPLATVGIELSMGNFVNSFGALMLFAANLGAVLVVMTISFWLYGFVPHELKMQKSSFKRVAIISFLVILVCIPLFISFDTIKTNNNVGIQARNYIENFILENDLKYEVSAVNVIKNTKKELDLRVELEIPEDVEKSTFNSVPLGLEKLFGKKVILDFKVIKILNIEI